VRASNSKLAINESLLDKFWRVPGYVDEVSSRTTADAARKVPRRSCVDEYKVGLETFKYVDVVRS
jgi:hypothetical protein